MAQVFDTGGTIDAIYGTSGGNTITFSNLQNGTSSYTLQNGYLIDGYSIGWQRSIQLKRVFNRNNRVAIVGYGQGQLSLSGLIGRADDFEQLMDATSGEDVCNLPVCTIEANSGFKTCSSDGSSSDSGASVIKVSGLLHAQIQITGQIQDNGILLQTCNMTFAISGVEINSKDSSGSASTSTGGGYTGNYVGGLAGTGIQTTV
jgi:hypothetical protein|nr:MAG TPA: hypothetical protein [Herelleviridae sp.]